MSDAAYWQERLPDVVFVAGQMGSGKDYFCDALVEQAGFTKYHIVTPFKMTVCAELGITLDELEADKAKYRPFLQDGAIERRAANPNCMVDLFDEQYRSGGLPKHLAVTGVRFINEAEYAIGNGFMVVLLDVAREVRLERLRRRDPNFDEARLDDATELEVPLLANYCHLRLDGTLPGELFPATLADYYRQMQLAYWRTKMSLDDVMLGEMQ